MKIRRSNSWSQSYEDFTMSEDTAEPAETSRETDRDRLDKTWWVCDS